MAGAIVNTGDVMAAPQKEMDSREAAKEIVSVFAHPDDLGERYEEVVDAIVGRIERLVEARKAHES